MLNPVNSELSGFAPKDKDTQLSVEKIRQFPEQWILKILFVKAGFAKTGDVFVEYDTVSTEEASKAIVYELNSLGLYADYEMTEQYGGHVFFARSANDLNDIKSANPADSVLLGEIYGIPSTAVEAFANKRTIDDKDLPPDILNHSLFQAIPFQPSLDHYNSEWQSFTEQCRKVKEDMPELITALNINHIFQDLEQKTNT